MSDNFHSFPPFKLEQVFYRAMLCEPCLQNGSCLHCGCKTPNMFYSVRKECGNHLWGEMFHKEENWEKFKQDNNLKFPSIEEIRKRLNTPTQVSSETTSLPGPTANSTNINTDTNDTKL